MPDTYPHLQWREVSSRQLLNGPIFSVEESHRVASDGREADYVLLRSADWVHVIAPAENDAGEPCFVMARQFRHGTMEVTLEFPGGVVDEREDPANAALRELEEETGYTADSLLLIGRTGPNPAFMTNTVCTYVARGVRHAVGRNLDANEIIDAELVPTGEILHTTNPQFAHHAIMLVGLHWYRLYVEDGLDYERRMNVGS
jgi:ADP-ribose pyrophosphatase